MPVTVGVNQMTVVHAKSGGVVQFMPDVCLTPAPPAPPVPIPYPNIALSQDAANGSKTVTADGNPLLVVGSSFSKSTGDEAGSNGGVASAKTTGAAEFIGHSFDVMADGKFVARCLDLMLGNKGAAFNTPPMPEQQPPAPGAPPPKPGEDKRDPDKLEIHVVDAAGQPLKDVRYVLQKPDGTVVDGTTDSSGVIQIDETAAGEGQIVFPDHPGFIVQLEP